ncbi:hypothetical protein VTJ83DRAFT_7368 [Remersonia thermophila]|uniref:Peptidase M48 domain-containing protein n=1 Tax=Remersonia thermophila TaxID=72144 RepID=A0ABR4D3E9_9PEZI
MIPLTRPRPTALCRAAGMASRPTASSDLLRLCTSRTSSPVPRARLAAARPVTSLASPPQPRKTRPRPAPCPGTRTTLLQTRPYHRSPNPHRPQDKPDPELLTRASRIRHARAPLGARLRAWWHTYSSRPLPSTWTVALIAAAAATAFYFAHLETVPVSGRVRFNVYSDESVRKAGEMEYRRLMADLHAQGVRFLPAWDWRVARVRRVMERLLPFSGMSDAEKDGWEVVVVDDDRTANAFVLPGGKVFVFSGIMRLAGSDAGLATVLGHEIAHNLAGHHGERLSQDIGASIALWSLVLMGGVIGLGPLLMHFFGSRFLDVAFGLPMSRLQESEADYIGLMMMAEACYDPREAVGFWARMERATGSDEVPEWMSTHPTNISRIKKIQEWLPQAMERRAQSDCSTTTASFADLFREAMRRGIIII